VLPMPLSLSPGAGSLRIGYDRQRSLHPSGARMSIYLNAKDPATRSEDLRISTASEMHFDVGHRSVRTVRVYCDSKTAEVNASNICVDVPRLRITLITPSTARQLTILHTVDEATRVANIVCVRVY
jgi:hypothetical protein